MDMEKDPLLEEALRISVKEGRASAAVLQTELGIGYVRAARIIEQLESVGSISKRKHFSDKELVQEVAAIIVNRKTISASKISKQFGIGYTRAVRVVEEVKRSKKTI